MNRRSWLAVAAGLSGAVWALGGRLLIAKNYLAVNVLGQSKTVEQRLKEHGAAVRERLEPDFRRAGVSYPPRALELAVFKREKRLELYAAGPDRRLRFIRDYAVRAASGGDGPKLREGDGQVPEGIYPIVSLNPNSLFHLSLRVGYPNAFDRAQAEKDGRARLGGDIMIHGNAVSIGCVAVGDAGAEDLFVLAASAGLPHVRVVISPLDLRTAPAPSGAGLPRWAPELYRRIAVELSALPAR